MSKVAQVGGEEVGVATAGHSEALTRRFSPLSMLGLAFAILNSWTALSASLSLALPSGGPSAVLWGLVTAGICNLCLAVSLAEMLSAYPSAAGQYLWTAMLAPEGWRRGLSWITGWINVAGWIALTCTGGLLGSQLIVGVISLAVPPYEPQPWHQFLIYIAYTVVAFLLNAFAVKLLPYVNKAAFIWSLAGFVIICITVLACSSGDYADARYVFGDFYNTTGWPDGVAWLLGLLQGGLGLTGYDAVSHMIEEIPNPDVEGPKIMIACVVIGLVTGFVFLMVLLFVSGGAAGLDNVITSKAGPILEILFTSTRSKAGAICLLVFPLLCLVFAATAILTTSSRMTWAFARDGGLPFSRVFARVHPTLDLPLNALILSTAIVIAFGCIFLGSSAALNAIVSASVVALGVSYGLPILVNMCQMRKALPPRPFTLSPLVGWTVNIVGVAYVILTTVLFLFPPDIPVDASSMNYCVVAFAIVLIISVFQWFVDGRKNFTGPKYYLGDGEVLTAEGSHDDSTAANDVVNGKQYYGSKGR